MTGEPTVFHNLGELIQARSDFVQEARALSPGIEREQKRQIARALKRLIENQHQAREFVVSWIIHFWGL